MTKKSCIKDTTYDPTCIGCEAVNKDTPNFYSKSAVHCPEPLPLEERSWEEKVFNIFGLTKEWKNGTYYYILTKDKEAFHVGTMSFEDFKEMEEEDLCDLFEVIKNVERDARLSEREKVVKEMLEDLKEPPFKDEYVVKHMSLMQSYVEEYAKKHGIPLSTPNELPHD